MSPYPIDDKFVVAVASSALFDLSESDAIFRAQGREAYREHQREHEDSTLPRGVAFPLLSRLLALNKALDGDPVEVVLLSRNDADTGLRIFKSIEAYGLPISRAAFVRGRDPFRYAEAFNASLFLSANAEDVRMALDHGIAAGQVFPGGAADDETDTELRIAFDFDGVLADDSAQRVFREGELTLFHASEKEQASEPMPAGPLRKFLGGIAELQGLELKKVEEDPSYVPNIRTAIVTARNAPAHERVVTTLRDWGILTDEAFFLGGIEKSRVLAEFRPHIFFDDQVLHVKDASQVVPSVHIPFGVENMVDGSDRDDPDPATD